jgi:hypothetical protein
MRKTFTFFILIAVGFQLMAQKSFEPVKRNLDYAQPGTHQMSKVDRTKAPGDVLFMEDFAGERWAATSDNGEPVPENAPEGWILGDDTGNGFDWRWDTIGARGQFTSIGGFGTGANCAEPREPVLTPTLENGYLMLEMDHFNSVTTCDEIGEEPMDAYIQYDAGLDFSAETAAHVIFEQANRFCCGFGEESNAWFEVSTDGGVTWSRQIASGGNISQGLSNFGEESYNTELDISTLVAGEAAVKFRFHVKGLTHYYWIIDDVMIIAPENNDIRFLDYWNDYITYMDGSTDNTTIESSEDFTEGYYEYPWFLTNEYKGFHAAYINFGGLAQTNLVHNVEIWKDGELDSAFSTTPVSSVAVGEMDTTMLQATYWPYQKGNYSIVHYPSADGIDQVPSNDTLKRFFKIGDTLVKVVDFDKVNSEISPDNWVSFDENGDGLGFRFSLPDPSLHFGDGNPDYYIADGVMVYIAANSDEEISLFENGSAKVVAGLYKFNEADDTYTHVISSSEIILSVSDTSSIKYIPFTKNGISEYLIEGGDYLVTVNMYGTWFDAGDRLQSWNVGNVNSNIQKHALTGTVCVNSTIATGDDVGNILEGPAFALDINYSGYIPPPPTYYITFKVKNADDNYIEGAKIECTGGIGGIRYTDSIGEARFSYSYGHDAFWVPFDYKITFLGYDTIWETGMLDFTNQNYNITMSPVGIQNSEISDIKIYPNPSNGIFTIDGEGEYNIQIFDMAGKVILEAKAIDNELVDMQNYNKGVYVIKVFQNQRSITKSIIIQ